MTALIETLRKSQAQAPSKALNISLWVAQIGGAGMFLMSSFGKLSANPQMVALFNAMGGQWFRYFTGLTELVGAALLLIPALSGVGGLLLSAVMVGALITHALIGGSPIAALVLLAAMGFVAWGRRDRTLRLLQRVL
jgi:putative oxidoreductase